MEVSLNSATISFDDGFQRVMTVFKILVVSNGPLMIEAIKCMHHAY